MGSGRPAAEPLIDQRTYRKRSVLPDSRGYDVLRLITRLNIGGPARQALLLTRRLNDEFPTLLAAGEPPEVESRLTDPAVSVHPVSLVRPLRPVQDAHAFSTVRSLLSATGARILHTHMAKAGAVGRLAALTIRPRPRMIHTFHGHVLDGYFSAAAQRCFVETERYLAKHTDLLVAVSPEVREALLGIGIGRPDQYRVVRLGLELDGFLCLTRPAGMLRAQLGLSPETPLVGIVGRLVPIKNHELLFNALRLLPDAHLVVIGDGELRPNLELLARRLDISNRVHFTGWVTAVPEALSDVDVVVLTSSNEGTPVALIEALAASKPIVATDVGGVRSVLRHGENGLLVESPQPSLVAQSIAQLLRNAELRQQFGRAGREYVRTEFSSERLIAEIRTIYRGMLIAPKREKKSSGS